MQINYSPLASMRHPTVWLRADCAKMWLEEEKPDETKRIEELKQKQKEREKARAEQRKQQQQKSQPFQGHTYTRSAN